jgi:hypothetical protein
MLSFQYHAISDFVPARERAEQAYAARDQAGPWAVYNCLPLPLAIAQGGDDVGAMELLDDIIERDRMTAAVPGTMACTVAVLGCLAGLRGDWSTATVLLACARAAFERGEARSSAEVALYVKYAFASLEFVGDDADRLSAEGASMSLRDAIDYGRRSNDDVHTL